MKRQEGFTLIEIITVILILGIIVNAWLPNYMTIKKKAQAARIVGDFLVMRDAATMYYSNNGHWPASTQWGRVPEGLDQYLPSDFQWDLRPEMSVSYSWDNLVRMAATGSESEGFVGVSVFSKDNGLLKAVRAVYGGRTIYARGFDGTGRVIFVVKTADRYGSLRKDRMQNATDH